MQSAASPRMESKMKKIGRKPTHLDELIPSTRHDDGILRIGAKANARDPFGVSLVSDGELAVTEGIPQLDSPVPRARDDLPVVGREGDGEDVACVSDKPAGGVSGR